MPLQSLSLLVGAMTTRNNIYIIKSYSFLLFQDVENSVKKPPPPLPPRPSSSDENGATLKATTQQEKKTVVAPPIPPRVPTVHKRERVM